MSTPTPLIFNYVTRDIANITGSFLEPQDWINVSKAGKGTRDLFKALGPTKMTIKITEMLLKAVFEGDPEKVKAILAFSRSNNASFKFNECIVLKRVKGKEEYESKSQKVMVCKREWKSISPLEAAAWAGDIFLLMELLNFLPEAFKTTAAEQLKRILDKTATGENGDFLAPFIDVLKAYEKYNTQYDALYVAKAWKKLCELWLDIGKCQRLLPNYGLQEFCDVKPHSPLPTFAEAPKRSLRLREDGDVDLDALGVLYTLYKGMCNGGYMLTAEKVRGWRSAPVRDFLAMSKFIKVRTSELERIIKWLLDPKAPLWVLKDASKDTQNSHNRCVIS